MNNWNRCKQQGQQGEEIIKQCLKQGGYHVDDITADWRKSGHKGDLIVNGLYLDIKTDNRIADTGNICLEGTITRKDGKQYQGWLDTAEYDYMCCLSPQKQVAYVIDYNAVKQQAGKIGKTINTPCLDGAGYRNQLYIMPIQQLWDMGIIGGYMRYSLPAPDTDTAPAIQLDKIIRNPAATNTAAAFFVA